VGWIRKTSATPAPLECRKLPSPTSNRHSSPYLATHAAASFSSVWLSTTRIALPSRTTSRPACQNDVRVGGEIPVFAFLRSGAEVHCLVMPHGDQRRAVRTSVWADRGKPRQFSCREDLAGRLPVCSRCFRIAVSTVEVDARRASRHQNSSPELHIVAIGRPSRPHRTRRQRSATPQRRRGKVRGSTSAAQIGRCYASCFRCSITCLTPCCTTIRASWVPGTKRFTASTLASRRNRGSNTFPRYCSKCHRRLGHRQ